MILSLSLRHLLKYFEFMQVQYIDFSQIVQYVKAP